MPKTVTIRLSDETYRSFLEQAKTENRPLSNFIETAVRKYISEDQFADDFEMAEILANEELVGRLKKGSQNAKKKKGKMIG